MKQISMQRGKVLLRASLFKADAIIDACVVDERIQLPMFFESLLNGLRTTVG